MTENLQADCVQSRQAGFVRCCPSKSGAVYIGYGAFPCVGEDENDEEVDAICFDIDDGSSITLTENDIISFEILDSAIFFTCFAFA